MSTANEIRQQIKDLQAQLLEMEGSIQEQKINAFHTWMVEHFGRLLKVGDVLTRQELFYAGGKVVGRKEVKVKVTLPMPCYTGYGNLETDLSYIYWGRAHISIRNMSNEQLQRDSLSKTRLKRFKLTSA